MSIQIAVRLPDDLVAYVDQQVIEGGASGRASVVARALRRELRQHLAERDARIYAESGSGDLEGLASWAAEQPLDLD